MLRQRLLTAFAPVLLLAGSLSAAWEDDVRLTNSDPGLEPYSFANRWLAASDSSVHVVWCDGRGVNGDVFYKRSEDAGANWSADVDLVVDSEYSQLCAVAADGKSIHVVWDGDRDGNEEIYTRTCTDGGSGWRATRRLTEDPAISKTPSVACWRNHAYVVWMDGRDPDQSGIFFAMSSDSGGTWTDDVRLTDAEVQVGAVVAVDDSMVHVAWADFREMTYKVYYKRSFDHGATWSADAALSSSTGLFPSISVSGMDVHAVWTNVEDELVYRGSTDGGATWSGEQQLSLNGDASTFGSVCISGPLVHVVWQENRYANESEIAYRLSRDHGATWREEVRLTDAWGVSSFPQIAADGEGVHVSWWDARDTVLEIYYKRDPDGNVPGVAEGVAVQPGARIPRLWPNPVLSSARVPGHEAEPFIVYDAAGRPVQECSGANVGAGLPAGVYLLRSVKGPLSPVRFVKL